MRPEFITFTGVDARSDFAAMAALSAQYPIEWGVLFSPGRQDREPRYPDLDLIRGGIQRYPGLRYAAHLCGGAAREVIDAGVSAHDEFLHEHFTRVQVNTTRAVVTAKLKAWGDALSLGVVVQCRDGFPDDPNVEWLFDTSGGRGQAPAAWPAPRYAAPRRVGFAGGLGPANVADALHAITQGVTGLRFWIDMESRVRDERDRFDLSKCRAVCEAVYGPSGVKTCERGQP